MKLWQLRYCGRENLGAGTVNRGASSEDVLAPTPNSWTELEVAVVVVDLS